MFYEEARRQDIIAAINELTHFLIDEQQEDGTWRFCFENGTTIDAYTIILLRAIGYEDESLIQQLHHRILEEQQLEGYWVLYADEKNGNLTATIDNYYALLYSGYSQEDDENMKRAKQYIVAQGGINRSKGLLSKAILAATGQISWPASISSIPIEIVILPTYAPVNLYSFSSYSRVHLIPMLLMAQSKFHIASPIQLQQLIVPSANRYSEEELSAPYLQMQALLQNSNNRLIGSSPHQFAKDAAITFMLERIEEDGTLYSYSSSTILMIFALLSQGFNSNDVQITKAVEGLLQMRGISSNNELTIQNSPSTIWDTALISYALQRASLPPHHPSIERANAYLLLKQQYKKGDWSIHNKDAPSGGWGFSETNTIHPDVDDTTAALRAIHIASQFNEPYKAASTIALNWILSMQNNDGGWPAFEKNVDNKMLTWLALDGAKAAAIDPSTADLTGRTLEYLGNYSELPNEDHNIQRGVNWILKNQEADGSWYGKWGICYIYGTWAAVTGLRAVGVSPNHKAVQKASKWLCSIQHEDGGWGESCESDRLMRYIPLQHSTPSQTAWALDALIAIHNKPTAEINKGIHSLMSLMNMDNWQTIYPTGAGLPGNFYVHYHSYRYIYPLLTLSNYIRKYLT